MSDKNATEVVLADAQGIAKAAHVLEQGGLVAVPTETVYGLAARADREDAVARIYKAKGRPDFNPLIVHVRDLEHAREFAEFPPFAAHLAATQWPGPLTLVLPQRADAGLANAVSAGLPTIGLRAPSHPVMQALLKAVSFPLAAPSANRSGSISPTTSAHVLETLEGLIDMVLDDKRPCQEGLESTIIKVREDDSWEELRPGPLDPGELNFDYAAQGGLSGAAPVPIEAPGQLASHYHPGKPMRLNAQEVAQDEFLIGFGTLAADCNLSVSEDLGEAASRLYACLHRAARSEKPRIAVATIPETGVGRAINDRLRRAATPPEN